MRIGVNAVPLRANSGGARYVFSALFHQLLRLDHQHRYLVFAHPAGVGLVREMLENSDLASGPDANVASRVRIISVIDEELIYPYRDEFDLYFNPINSLKPRIFDRPTVVILHDVQEQYFPQYFSYADLMSRHEVYPEICRAATIVATVSEFCKRCFIEKFGIDPAKIQVVYNAPQPHLTARDADDGGSWSAAPLPKPFFLYPANTYPHKNHALLLDAMQILAGESKGAAGPHAVFTGQPMPGGYPLKDEIAKRNLQAHCHVFSHLSVDEMRFLYRNATAVVMPTMFEGFGLPAVEALACGCPLVCSDIPALREVAGENALYFPAGNLDALCASLRRIIAHGALRAQLIERGYEAAKRFAWETSGRRMLAIFEEAPARFKSGYACRDASKPRPRIGVLISNPNRDGISAILKTFTGLVETNYENLVFGIAGNFAVEYSGQLELYNLPEVLANDSEGLLDFARRANLDLVGLTIAPNRARQSALDSLALLFAEAEPTAVYLGEAAVWKAKRYRGIARLRYTGDEMWRIEKLLYPEMMFLCPAALAKWPAGLAAIAEGGKDWRWKLLLAARMQDQLTIVRRTLADCDRSSLPRLAWIKAFAAGMLDFHRLDNSPAPVPLLRRFERRVRMLSQLLPQSLQHVGTKWWYRLTRSRQSPVTNELPASPPPAPLP